MSLNIKTEEYYKRFIELQEKLRKSEEERLKLEMKFNEMVRVTREEEQVHFRKLRAQYKRFLEEDRRRQDRNERILRSLERIENRVAVLMAKTERFKLLRRQYQTFLDRVYVADQIKKPEAPKPVEHEKLSPMNDDKTDLVQSYIQNLSSHKLREMLRKEEEARGRLATDPDDKFNYPDLYTYNREARPNYASTIADDIMNSIYSRSSRLNDNSRLKPSTEFNNNMTQPAGNMRLYEKSPSTNYRMPEFKNYSTTFQEDKQKDSVSETEDTETDDISESAEVIHKTPEFNKAQTKNNKPVDAFSKLASSPLTDTQNSNKEQKFKENLSPESASSFDIKNMQQTDENAKVYVESKLSNQDNVDSSLVNPVDTQHEIVSSQNVSQPLENIPKESAPRSDITKELPDQMQHPSRQQTGDETVTQNINSGAELEPAQPESSPENLIKQKEQYQQELISESQQPDVIKVRESTPTHQELDKTISEPDQNLISGLHQPQNDVRPTDQYLEEYDDTAQNDNSQEVQPYNQQSEYAENYQQDSQPTLQSEVVNQYDSTLQPVVQYDENGQPIPQGDLQYPPNSQPVQQYDSGQLIQQYEQQYDEHGQLIQQYDENGQPFQHYDESGQPNQLYSEEQYQYDQNAQYDEHGQLIPQYDEQGQLIQGYDPSAQQYDENGQLIQSYDYGQAAQYDEHGQLIQQVYDDQQYYDQTYEGNVDMSSEKYQENPVAPQDSNLTEQQLNEEPPKASNVMEMLDTDTDSLKQDTKVSHDSDFDFSNA